MQTLKRRVATYLESSNVYLIFDRYDDFSIKSVARGGRETGVSRIYQLNPKTVLPAQNVVLTVMENKKQLMNIICNELTRDMLFHTCLNGHKLVITGKDPYPVEIANEGEDIKARYDIETSHGDIIKVHQVLKCANKATQLTVVKILRAGCDLSAIGEIGSPLEKVIKQATASISACYGVKQSGSMSDTRIQVWGSKNGKGHVSALKVCAIPPTEEVF